MQLSLVFPIFSLTLFLIFYIVNKRLPALVFTALTGAVLGVLLSCLLSFFFFSSRYTEYNFALIFLYYLKNEFALPALALYLLFLLIIKISCRKVTDKEIIPYLFTFLLSFYCIYAPYVIIKPVLEYYTAFELFLKPLLFFSLVCIVVTYLYKIKSKKAAPLVVIFILLLIIPSILCTLWRFNLASILVFVLSILYSLYAVVLFVKYLIYSSITSTP